MPEAGHLDRRLSHFSTAPATASRTLILVDAPIWKRPDRPGVRFAHLASDESLEELHAFAAELGIDRRRFGGDHYDVPDVLVERVLALGATQVGAKEMVRRLRAAGLRSSTHPTARGTASAQGQAPRASDV